MLKSSTDRIDLSTSSSDIATEPDEIQGFSYNAYRILGTNYLAKKWLPKKGPYFIALVLAMRAYVYYDYETGQQQTSLYPEAATIAERAGMSRAKVFKLLRDPDMALFIRRIPRRRWDKAMQKEVVTSNLYMVAMDDPPTPEDMHLVEEEQARINAIKRGDTIVEGRPHQEKSSESTRKTLIAVHAVDSDSRLPRRRNNLVTINNSHEEVTSIAPRGESMATGKTPTGQRNSGEKREAKQYGSQETEKSKNSEIGSDRQRDTAPPIAAPPPASVPDAELSEAEAWRADVRGWLEAHRVPSARGEGKGQTIIEHQMRQYGVEDTGDALTNILAVAAPLLAPLHTTPEMVAELADQARRRASLYAWKRDEQGELVRTNPGGYYLTVLENLIRAYAAHPDVTVLARKTAKMERTAAAAGNVSASEPVMAAQPRGRRTTIADVPATSHLAAARQRVRAPLPNDSREGYTPWG